MRWQSHSKAYRRGFPLDAARQLSLFIWCLALNRTLVGSALAALVTESSGNKPIGAPEVVMQRALEM